MVLRSPVWLSLAGMRMIRSIVILSSSSEHILLRLGWQETDEVALPKGNDRICKDSFNPSPNFARLLFETWGQHKTLPNTPSKFQKDIYLELDRWEWHVGLLFPWCLYFWVLKVWFYQSDNLLGSIYCRHLSVYFFFGVKYVPFML